MLLLILNCKLLANRTGHVKKKNERRLRVRRNVYNVDNVENEREFLLTKRFPSLQNNHFKKVIILFVHRNKTKLLKKTNQCLLFIYNASIYIPQNITIVNNLRQKLFSCQHTRTDYSSILQWLVEIVIATVR